MAEAIPSVVLRSIQMERSHPVSRSTMGNTAGSPFLFRPRTISASQYPKVLLPIASGRRSSIEYPKMCLESFGFLRECRFKTSESSNNVIGSSPDHNSLYKVFVQEISQAGNSCSRCARPTQASNDQLFTASAVFRLAESQLISNRG